MVGVAFSLQLGTCSLSSNLEMYILVSLGVNDFFMFSKS